MVLAGDRSINVMFILYLWMCYDTVISHTQYIHRSIINVFVQLMSNVTIDWENTESMIYIDISGTTVEFLFYICRISYLYLVFHIIVHSTISPTSSFISQLLLSDTSWQGRGCSSWGSWLAGSLTRPPLKHLFPNQMALTCWRRCWEGSQPTRYKHCRGRFQSHTVNSPG